MSDSKDRKSYLVTGATGFLGGHLVRTLLADGHSVRALGRDTRFGMGLSDAGAEFRPVDLKDRAAMIRACEGVDVVIHSGALSSAWGRYEDFYDANVRGTEHVAEGCLAHGVGRLVYVSSPSVMSRHEVQLGLDESHPLPERFVSVYSETKALGEARVTAAGAKGLETVIIRPKAIYGPGDRALFPRIVESLRSGRLPIFGEGETLTDITHVSDVVQACLLAAERDEARGQTYLVTGGEPVNLWDVIRLIAEELDLAAPSRQLTVKKAMRVAAVLELLWRALPLKGEPPLTRYKVSVLSFSQTYDISAARRDLGYAPKVPWRDGVRDFLASLQGDIAPEGGDRQMPEDGTGKVAQRRRDAEGGRAEASAPDADNPTLPSLRGSAPLRDTSSPDASNPGTGGLEVPTTLFVAGHTIAPLWALGREGGWKKTRVPAMFALLEHPSEGPVLYDTGYSTHFHEATSAWPYKLYAKLTPVDVQPADDAATQLAARGVDPKAVRWIIISHFDPDHIGGLRDFPNARFVCEREAWDSIAGKSGLKALKARMLPGLLPEDFAARVQLLPRPAGAEYAGLGPSHDLFGDGSLRLVSLTGHAPGQLGALVTATGGEGTPGQAAGELLLCADACWSTRQLEPGQARRGLHHRIAENKGEQAQCYARLARVRAASPEIHIIPTHCLDQAQALGLRDP